MMKASGAERQSKTCRVSSSGTYGRRILSLFSCLLLLAGCESIAKGITSAVLDSREDQEDTRLCVAEGAPFPGVMPYLEKQDSLPPIEEGNVERPQVKLLYVHGIGTHTPGHSIDLMQNLAASLDLEIRAPRNKRIVLKAPQMPDQELGEMNLARFTDQARQRDFVFYELTWSPINKDAKEAVEFDSLDVYKNRRASINQALRSFVNDVGPDPIAFAGNKGDAILTSISQAMCWMWSSTWSELPEETVDTACELNEKFGSRAAIDDSAIISHSLGSRATMDALQAIVRRADDPEIATNPDVARLTDALKNRDLQFYMLSNQLPLLEAGQDPQEKTGAEAEYCGPNAPLPDQRFFKSLQMVAFSDPNDTMSYPIPAEWVETYVDSRLCPKVTNVTINIAQVNSLLGLGELADPLTAHIGYSADERVGGLIAQGDGHKSIAPIVEERCTWLETDEKLMD